MHFLEYVEQSYQTIDFHNYLVLQQKGVVTPIDYCCKMMELNQIAGLLPVYTKQMNDQISFYYDISGKVRLIDFLKRNTCTEAQGRMILLHLAESLRNIAKYFLQQQFCILDLQYVFINDAFDIFFPVLPLKELLHETTNLQDFFQKLVSQYFVTEENQPFYDNLLKYLVRAEFHLEELIKRLQPERQAEPSPIQKQESKPLPVTTLQAEPLQVNKMERRLFAKSEPKAAIEQPTAVSSGEQIINGIKVPGALPEVEKPQKKTLFAGGKKAAKQDKTEKKVRKEFHLFGGSKEKKTKPESAVIQQPLPQISTTDAQRYPAVSAAPQPTMSQALYIDDATVMLDGEQLGESMVYLMHQNQRIPVCKTPFVLGKANADYKLEQSFISRIHATIVEQEGIYYLQDENSKNHTYLNGVQLAPYTLHPLENGSRIKLGIEEFIFYIG